MKENEEHIEIRVLINNELGGLAKLILEPWGEEVKVHRGDVVSLLASGPKQHARIDQEYVGNELIVAAHHGWTLAVSINGQAHFTGSAGFPAM